MITLLVRSPIIRARTRTHAHAHLAKVVKSIKRNRSSTITLLKSTTLLVRVLEYVNIFAKYIPTPFLMVRIKIKKKWYEIIFHSFTVVHVHAHAHAHGKVGT